MEFRDHLCPLQILAEGVVEEEEGDAEADFGQKDQTDAEDVLLNSSIGTYNIDISGQ